MSSERILLLATEKGVCTLPVQTGEKLGALEFAHSGVSFEAICRDANGTFFAGAGDGGIFSSEDGMKWLKVFDGFPKSRGLWSLAAHPVRPRELYAGLEPASLWISWDGGERWEELPALRKHSASKQWSFYEPMKPHVRAIAFNRDGAVLHVGIEEGGNLASADGGNSFEDRTPGSNPDVHHIRVSHDDPGLVFLLTGGGLFRSRTGGRAWEKMSRGLDRSYAVPLAMLHSDGKVLCAGAAGRTPGQWESKGADAAIYTSEDWGASWKMSEGPFPLRGMLASIIMDPEERNRLFAGTNDGLLLQSSDFGKTWKTALDDLPRIEEMEIGWR